MASITPRDRSSCVSTLRRPIPSRVDCSPLLCACSQLRAENVEGIQQLVELHRSAPHPRDPFDVNARADNGDTALHWSVAAGVVELVAIVANLPGVDLSARDTQGRTPLHIAALHSRESTDHLQCAFLLVELGGPELGGVADDDGATALHLAAEKGAQQTAAVLIHSGVKVDGADHDGMTPLQLGAYR